MSTAVNFNTKHVNQLDNRRMVRPVNKNSNPRQKLIMLKEQKRIREQQRIAAQNRLKEAKVMVDDARLGETLGLNCLAYIVVLGPNGIGRPEFAYLEYFSAISRQEHVTYMKMSALTRPTC
jgi:hypothetical protein